MATPIKIKRSAVQGKAPTTSDLALGELAVNTYDGKLYTRKDDGTASIVEIGAGGGGGDGELYFVTVDGTTTQTLATTLATIDFDTSIATSGAGDFTIGTGGEITVVNAGNYFIEYSLNGDQTSGNNRVVVSGELQLNGTAIAGSECSVYSRNTDDGAFTAVGTAVVVLSANDVIRVQAQKNDGAITTQVDLTTSAISIFSLAGAGAQGEQGIQGIQGPTDVPQNDQSGSGSYTLVATDNGKHVKAAGSVTIPSSVFTEGNTISIYNDTASSITITQGSGTTLREAGTANTGSVNLSQRGLCSILCVGSEEFVATGNIA